MKADLAVVFGARRSEELANGTDYLGDLFVVGADPRVEFGQFFGKHFVVKGEAAKRDERADDDDADLRGPVAVEDICGHQCAVFGECPRQLTKSSVTRT